MKSSVSRLLFLCCWMPGFAARSLAAETNASPRFDIRGYLVKDPATLLSTNLGPTLSPYTGTNAGLSEIVHAAAALQSEYSKYGYTSIAVAVGEHEITDGIVTMHVAQSAFPQILISGQRYIYTTNEVAIDLSPLGSSPGATARKPQKKVKPPTKEEEALRAKIAELKKAEIVASLPPQPPPTTQLVLAAPVFAETNNVEAMLHHKMADLENQEKRGQLLPPPATNSVATGTNVLTFEVRGYKVTGNTLLSSNLVELILQPYIGTNITFDKVASAVTDLQAAYRERGFATVAVTVPADQKLVDKIIQFRVFEGRLVEINVENNRYFSSNNVMRALPSLHQNMILTRPVFEAELDRANANQDRQIYPLIEPGPIEGTSALKLQVKDRLPLHAKLELNNQNSPGTPDLRVNASAAYNNLWDLEHSLGLQYSFSPEAYKTGDQWNAYDEPLVANYSGFYRIPLNGQEPIDAAVASDPGNFGYSEATRQFRLPPPTGRTELNVFSSRSTVDTGMLQTPLDVIESIPGFLSVSQQNDQQDLTVNEDLGFRLSLPAESSATSQSGFSGGLDYKTYHLSSTKTNNFFFTITTFDQHGNPNTISSTVDSPVPKAQRFLEYLPLSMRYDGSWRGSNYTFGAGVGVSGNLWYSSSTTITSTTNSFLHETKSLQGITGSSKSTGHWLTLTPSANYDWLQPQQWMLSLRGNAQWSSEPLVSTEQFGVGGVNSVRGYHEGEVFGDYGWQILGEEKTPPHIVGLMFGNAPLTLRGSLYAGYGETYLLDPQGRKSPTRLAGAGLGGIATVGSRFEGKILWSYPLISTTSTPAFEPRFDFSMSLQF
jgi:hemolysin activation/secretion protein